MWMFVILLKTGVCTMYILYYLYRKYYLLNHFHFLKMGFWFFFYCFLFCFCNCCHCFDLLCDIQKLMSHELICTKFNIVLDTWASHTTFKKIFIRTQDMYLYFKTKPHITNKLLFIILLVSLLHTMTVKQEWLYLNNP